MSHGSSLVARTSCSVSNLLNVAFKLKFDCHHLYSLEHFQNKNDLGNSIVKTPENTTTLVLSVQCLLYGKIRTKIRIKICANVSHSKRIGNYEIYLKKYFGRISFS